MRKYYALCCLFLITTSLCSGQAFIHAKGQSLLYFKKNGHREAVYAVGDKLTFELKATKTKVSDQIIGFQDSLILFQHYSLNPKEIAALYVDDKTKIWFIFRYKYEKAFFLAGGLFLPIDVINTGQVEPKALAVSGLLLGAGLLARWLVSEKLRITGKRKLLIITY
ncbi:MAG: hypothetical protein EOO60_04905 [Hymenobacter sp.]|nr:MAG: hypothetical protein EOO60_04905 [Hymenobacter sp.]